ncbi:MAG: ArsR family transcriptional regulator [Hyphomicrobiales bacterium]|nr:MAG: ArsR family transcriptional regulator [Hyphomicrobiales bacterium]
MTYDNAFAALADPSRRRIFERLRGGPLPVARIAAGMPISRPAVSQHLQVLKAAGLVSDEAVGTRRLYSIDQRGLDTLRAWLDQFWADALQAFKTEVERPSRTRKGKRT